ncbi:MAG: hypothetical protein UY31_C0075G0006 [Candidatus Wolfebacteria bacterium GW2011_GWE1_48_7]|nr:MAG: hypothetical protein UY31_C0075G0006 [Candidatus Wolfebacteria bacterium GW2011_GWE1_48_7]HBN86720.1 hypothetical protein [Candidatus Wolfebacteria bacterium]
MLGLRDTRIEIRGGTIHSRWGFIPNITSLKEERPSKKIPGSTKKAAIYRYRRFPQLNRDQK